MVKLLAVVTCLLWAVLALGSCNNTEPTPAPPPSPDTERLTPGIRGSAAWQERAEERDRMVRTQIESRDIRDSRLLKALREVPRHLFVPGHSQRSAYADHPLGIGEGQTISQPYIVAFMTDALRLEPKHKVLEIGTGSGYQAAILAELVDQVFTIEIVESLGKQARDLLDRIGYEKVSVRIGDGYRGWPDQAPFDAIIVTAAPDHVPPALVEQLKVGGRMVIPVGDFFQELMLITKTRQGVEKRSILPVRFVPMTGEAEE